MLRLLYISILLILPLQMLASTSYSVRIAVYNSADALEHELNKLSPALRKTIEVKKRGHQLVASSINTDKKETLQKLLPSYQKVFPDAFIAEEEAPEVETPKIDNIQTQEVNTTTPQTEQKETNASQTETFINEEKNLTVTPEPKIIYDPYSRKVTDPINENLSLYTRLHQKTLYLCAYGPEEWSPNVLIHIAFFDKDVIYTPIQGDVSSKREKFKIIEDRLYISHKGVFNDDMYSTIEETTQDYYLISTWIGKKKMTSIRYYFDLGKAEEYVKTLR